jgi:hypothetical protein
MSHYALPQMRPIDGVWIEPRFGGALIGIVHLVTEEMRETYLRHGLLYDAGDYLSPEEVPGLAPIKPDTRLGWVTCLL